MEAQQGFTIFDGENYHNYFMRMRKELENANPLTKPQDIDSMMRNVIRGVIMPSDELHAGYIPDSPALMNEEAPPLDNEQFDENKA